MTPYVVIRPQYVSTLRKDGRHFPVDILKCIFLNENACISIKISPWCAIRWKHFPRYLPFIRGIPLNGEFPPQKPVTRSFDLFFDLRLDKDWINYRGVGDLRRYRAHFDVTVMLTLFLRVKLTTSKYCFWWWLGTGQATNHCLKQWWLVYWRAYASLGLNELMYLMESCIIIPFHHGITKDE